MEKTKFTPGPWLVIEGEDYEQSECLFVDAGEALNGDFCICQMHGPDEQANAKLIAAAPDLLKALLMMCEDNGYDLSLPIEGFSLRTQKVISAIKKATE